jgi:hypothetical protein
MRHLFPASLRPLLVVATIMGAGCAGTPPQPKAPGRANIVNASPSRPIAATAVRYRRQTGTCDARSVQLLSRAEGDAMSDGWKEPEQGCDGPGKRRLPVHGDAPTTARRTHAPGSAHVLVRLQADGQIESVKAVCATDASFAEAAVETISKIEFSPMTCRGVPTRVAFFLPLDYEYR